MKRGSVCLLFAVVCLLGILLLRSTFPAQEREPSREDAVSAVSVEHRTATDTVESLLSGMTKEEKVWQMLVLRPEQLTGCHSTSDAVLWTEGFQRCPVGGVFFNGDNISSEGELKAMLAAAGGSVEPAPFLCVDEEGGTVARLAYALGVTTDFAPMFTYRAGGTRLANQNAETIGRDISSFGFNVNFAPVADVWTNAANTVIGKRAYSDEPAEAAELVSAAVQGFHAGGVMAVLKHFPGHGDTAEDSHLGAAYSDKTLEELRACEFLPFSAGIAQGADMVMMGHITLNKVDPGVPASLSYRVVTELLREELGFGGVVITDAMEMSAVAEPGCAEAAVMAVEAGCDLLLTPVDPESVVSALLERIPEARLDESVRRILRLKLERGLLASE